MFSFDFLSEFKESVLGLFVLFEVAKVSFFSPSAGFSNSLKLFSFLLSIVVLSLASVADMFSAFLLMFLSVSMRHRQPPQLLAKR